MQFKKTLKIRKNVDYTLEFMILFSSLKDLGLQPLGKGYKLYKYLNGESKL